MESSHFWQIDSAYNRALNYKSFEIKDSYANLLCSEVDRSENDWENISFKKGFAEYISKVPLFSQPPIFFSVTCTQDIGTKDIVLIKTTGWDKITL